jgi:Protein of unknown function (DUF1566)
MAGNMKINKLLCFASILLLLAACGGGGTIEVSNFPAMTKTEGDSPFELKPPSSKSPAAFSYSSSDPAVATISGSVVTVLLAGTTTITASQASTGSYGSSTISALLTVKQIVCTAPQVRENGKCVAPAPVCTAPATLQNNICVAPPFGTGVEVALNNATWMPVAFSNTWTNANAYCTTTTIKGLTGWRLPTEFELNNLYTSHKMDGQGWLLGDTWSSTTKIGGGFIDARAVAVSLVNGSATFDTGGSGAYIACVR